MKFQPLKEFLPVRRCAYYGFAARMGWCGCFRVTARPSPDWLRSGTIYEIFPRDFSVDGNLGGVTAKLDELQSLGVNILWTMPIHPIGQKFRKGDYGSPYSIKDYYAVDANYGTVSDYQQLVSEAHSTWNESHHGSCRGPHRVGQRNDGASGILQT